jgi:hypothetical protein
MSLLSTIKNISGWKRTGIIILVCLVVLGSLTAVILSRWADIKSWTVKKLAIEKPAKIITEIKIEYRDRWRTKIIIEQPDGTKITRESTHEAAATTTNAHSISIPVIPGEDRKKHHAKNYYLAGGIGASADDPHIIYLLGGGVYLCDWLAVGLQAQSTGQSVSGFAIITFSF